MKKISKILLFSLICLLVLSGCGETSTNKQYSSYEELNGQKIGDLTGSVFDIIAKDVFPDSEIVYYNKRVSCRWQVMS